MNEKDFITKFYSCDNEEQFLKDICHNLNCLQKVQNNWNELKKWLEDKDNNGYEKFYVEDMLILIQDLEGNHKDEIVNE